MQLWKRCSVGAGLLVLSHSAFAALGEGLTFQGVTFSFQESTSAGLTLRVEDALNGGTGNWSDVTHLAAFQIGIDGLTGASITNPTGWSTSTDELNAKGCAGGGSTNHYCFETASPLELSDDFSFDIALQGVDPLDVYAFHLKVAFIDQQTWDDYFGPDCDPCGDGWKTTSDLLSQTVPIPEPEIYATMALGMGLLGWVARRKKRKQ